MMVEKITYVENLVDLFTKTLTRKVFVGHNESIGFR